MRSDAKRLYPRECKLCGAVIHFGHLCYTCRRREEASDQSYCRRLELRQPRITKVRLP